MEELHTFICFLWEDKIKRQLILVLCAWSECTSQKGVFMGFSIQDEGEFVIRISVPVQISHKIVHLIVSSVIWTLNTSVYLKMKFTKLIFNKLKHLKE